MPKRFGQPEPTPERNTDNLPSLARKSNFTPFAKGDDATAKRRDAIGVSAWAAKPEQNVPDEVIDARYKELQEFLNNGAAERGANEIQRLIKMYLKGVTTRAKGPSVEFYDEISALCNGDERLMAAFIAALANVAYFMGRSGQRPQ